MISEVRGKGYCVGYCYRRIKTNGRTVWDLCLLMKNHGVWPNQPMTISSVWLLLWLFRGRFIEGVLTVLEILERVAKRC